MEPNEIDALLERANRLLDAGEPEAALHCLDRLDGDELEGDDRTEWGSLRAWALSELNRHREAMNLLEDLIEEFPDSSRLLGTLGVVLSNNDELEDARDTLEEAVQANPEDEVALANLALVLEKLREYTRAAELYDRASELGADIDWVLQRKAAILVECGQYAEAKATLKRYLSLAPEDASQWIALGILHSDDEEYTAAFQCYEQAEAVDPISASLRLNWGVTAVRARDLKRAYVQLTELQRIEPRSTRSWLLRAFILEEEGDLNAAARIYDQILQRRGFTDQAELSYALEMAMDFCARHDLRARCSRLLRRAYAANICTVELCEAYREAVGDYAEEATWYSLVIEADYRPGLTEVADDEEHPPREPTRFIRDFQVVARNHDEAVGIALDLANKMGEGNPRVREFIGQETVKKTHTGIYEVERRCYVFNDED